MQFAAAPWLRHHMLNEIDNLSEHLLGNVDSLMERASAAARSLKDRSAPGAVPGRGAILDLLQNPEEKAALSHLTAVMSLLEGHANVVMDAVDASIVPSVKTIRQRFNARGKDRGVIEKFIRSLLGLDAKMRQYRDGAKFVRAVVAVAGMEGFNRVWESAGQLPTEPEIHDSKLWLERMGLCNAGKPPPPSGRHARSAVDAGPAGWRPSSAPRGRCSRTPSPRPATRSGWWWPAAAGPDSLALAAIASYFARRGHVDGHAVSVGAAVIDHQLQPGSADVAAKTAAVLRELGLSPVEVRTVDVATTGAGPEAAARDARHAALESVAARTQAGAILLGHTLDDQAEQVLLGLARGSGTRSLAGMRPARGKLLRPFLGPAPRRHPGDLRR